MAQHQVEFVVGAEGEVLHRLENTGWIRWTILLFAQIQRPSPRPAQKQQRNAVPPRKQRYLSRSGRELLTFDRIGCDRWRTRSLAFRNVLNEDPKQEHGRENPDAMACQTVGLALFLRLL